jgi:hypothetical protein
MKTLYITLFCLIHICSYAQRNDVPKQSINALIGTTGFGAGYQYQINSKFAFGGSISRMNMAPTLFMKSLSVDRQFRITATAKFTDVSGFIKWFPFGKSYYEEWEDNWSYVKVGLLYRGMTSFSIRSDFQPKQPGSSFNEANLIRGNLAVDVSTWKLQPFLNIGHQLFGKNNAIRGFFEWGASLQGSPLTQIQQTVTPGIQPVDESKIRKTINAIKIYPDLNFQVGYWF